MLREPGIHSATRFDSVLRAGRENSNGEGKVLGAELHGSGEGSPQHSAADIPIRHLRNQ